MSGSAIAFSVPIIRVTRRCHGHFHYMFIEADNLAVEIGYLGVELGHFRVLADNMVFLSL
jgi:hypothetical protein